MRLVDYAALQRELKELGMEQFQTLATAAQYFPIYDKILEHLKPCTVLDWGCGNGHLSYFLLKNGFEVHALGMEKFEKAAEFQARFPGKYTYTEGSDPVALPFEDDRFDAVFSMGVLEHVRETGGNELGSLLEIKRVLKPAGKFLCFHFPNRRSYIEALGRAFPKKHHHQFMYSKQIIRELAEQSGLTVEELGMYGALPRNELKRLPSAMANSGAFASFYGGMDRGFGFVFRPFVQNFYFIARAPAE
jgi:SAM-dependent methyltransferase